MRNIELETDDSFSNTKYHILIFYTIRITKTAVSLLHALLGVTHTCKENQILQEVLYTWQFRGETLQEYFSFGQILFVL